jgi:microcystin degradation protein MlrC
MTFDFRVLTCEFAHETNTFSIVPTTIDNFKRQVYLITKDEIIKNKMKTKTTLGIIYK